MGTWDKIRVFAVGVAMLVAAAAPIAEARSDGQGGGKHAYGRGWRGHGPHGMDRLFGELGLTEAQKGEIEQIRENHRQTIQPLLEELRTKRRQVHELSRAESFDEVTVRQRLTEIADLEARLMAEQFRIRQEMLGVLTPEQKAQFEQKREEFKTRRSERRGRAAQGAVE
jgi:protein CpxP